MACPTCGADHARQPLGGPRRPGGDAACPYAGLAYRELRAGHDEIFFGRWRRTDAGNVDIRRARNLLDRHLRAIRRALEAEDVPAARADLNKAFEAFLSAGGGDEEAPETVMYLDRALSYAHRALGDLLHEKGVTPHSPVDFASWYEAGEIPFREDW